MPGRPRWALRHDHFRHDKDRESAQGRRRVAKRVGRRWPRACAAQGTGRGQPVHGRHHPRGHQRPPDRHLPGDCRQPHEAARAGPPSRSRLRRLRRSQARRDCLRGVLFAPERWQPTNPQRQGGRGELSPQAGGGSYQRDARGRWLDCLCRRALGGAQEGGRRQGLNLRWFSHCCGVQPIRRAGHQAWQGRCPRTDKQDTPRAGDQAQLPLDV
mmetsp:Transcript_13884/g.27421  ORF Transcript_13884/g.27421 Transcript_13884/m.27421 type:complete len:213 (-) Transcript_13884:430-1068(-)